MNICQRRAATDVWRVFKSEANGRSCVHMTTNYKSRLKITVVLGATSSLSSYLSCWATKTTPFQGKKKKKNSIPHKFTQMKCFSKHLRRGSARSVTLKQDNVQHWHEESEKTGGKKEIWNTQGIHLKTQERHSTTLSMWWADDKKKPNTIALILYTLIRMQKFDLKTADEIV